MATGLSRRSTSETLTLIKWLCIVSFLPYLACVLWLTLLNREPTVQRSMLTPFWEYRNMLSGHRQWFFFWQIVGNLVMLLPLGFMLPAMTGFFRKGLRAIFLVFCSSVAIELTQWYTARGLMEFDDVFNNTMGGIIGYLLFWLCFLRFSKKNDT